LTGDGRNKRLGEQEYIKHPADEKYFADLKGRVQALLRDGESFILPDVNEPYAWRRLYATHVALSRRDASEIDASAGFYANGRPAKWADHEWDNYIQSLAALQEIERRDRPAWSMLQEYFGLSPDDLSDPIPGQDTPYGQYGRYPNWQARAGRVSWALARLRGMTIEERERVPQVLHERRQEARMKAIEQRLAAIESRLQQEWSVT
jgi:hypothetical protein